MEEAKKSNTDLSSDDIDQGDELELRSGKFLRNFMIPVTQETPFPMIQTLENYQIRKQKDL